MASGDVVVGLVLSGVVEEVFQADIFLELLECYEL